MSRERIENVVYQLLVAVLVAFPIAWIVMIGLGMWHAIHEPFPAFGYWWCFVYVLVYEALLAALRAFSDWRAKRKAVTP